MLCRYTFINANILTTMGRQRGSTVFIGNLWEPFQLPTVYMFLTAMVWVVICILVWVFSFSRTGQFLNEVMKETWGQFEQWEGFRRWCDIDDATFAVITATFLSRDFSISSHYQGSIDFNTEEGSISWYLQGWYWMTWSSEIILSNTLPRERIGKYCHRQ